MVTVPLGIFVHYPSLVYLQGVARALVGSETDILLPRCLLEDEAQYPLVASLRARGCSLRCAEDAAGRHYRALAVTTLHDPAVALKDYAFTWDRVVAVLHATVFMDPLSIPGVQHYLTLHERQAEQMAGPYALSLRTRRMNAAQMDAVKALGGVSEFACAGMYQLGKWEQQRHTPKEALKGEVETTFGVTLPSELPLVLYCSALHEPAEEHVDGLLRLARHAVVIFKPYYDAAAYDALEGVSNLLLLRGGVNLSPNLARFAADAVLASPQSGVLTTCAMLGCRTIACTTDTVGFSASGTLTMCPWEVLLQSSTTTTRMGAALGEALGGVVRLSQTDELRARLNDTAAFAAYEQNLPALQQTFFGNYAMTNAATRAARLLLRVGHAGTFGEDTLLLRVDAAAESDAVESAPA